MMAAATTAAAPPPINSSQQQNKKDEEIVMSVIGAAEDAEAIVEATATSTSTKELILPRFYKYRDTVRGEETTRVVLMPGASVDYPSAASGNNCCSNGRSSSVDDDGAETSSKSKNQRRRPQSFACGNSNTSNSILGMGLSSITTKATSAPHSPSTGQHKSLAATASSKVEEMLGECVVVTSGLLLCAKLGKLSWLPKGEIEGERLTRKQRIKDGFTVYT